MKSTKNTLFTSFLIFCLVIPNIFTAQNKIQEMIDNTPDGGSITIPEGKYIINETINIEGRNGLTIQGEGKCKILLTDVWQNVVNISNSNSVKIKGLYISHLKPLKEYQCNGGVLLLNNTKKILIENCELEGSGTIAISCSVIRNLEVSHCYIHDNTFNAFYFNNAAGVLIHNCVIENNANLIQSYKLDDFEMSDNLIRNNGGYWRQKGKSPGLIKK